MSVSYFYNLCVSVCVYDCFYTIQRTPCRDIIHSFCSLPVGVATLSPSALSRPMQRKLVTLVNCQLVEEEGRVRAVRAGRSLGERTVTELILQHQNPQQLSANLWAAVRARGCQFLGPGTDSQHVVKIHPQPTNGAKSGFKVLWNSNI